MPTTGERFERAVAIMARLRGPGGCPWDREQTFDSIKPYTLEETYEVLEAIDNRDWDELPGELGDLLLQVLFYAQMAKDDGTFSIDDVLDRLSTKLVDRHPHVFGDVKADTSSEVLRNWQALKVEEKEKTRSRNRGNREATRICAGRRFHGDAVTDGSLQAQFAGRASRFRLAEHGRPLRKTARGNDRTSGRIERIPARPVLGRRAEAWPVPAHRKSPQTLSSAWKPKSEISSLSW